MKRFAILDGLRGYFLVFMMLNHLPFQGELLLARINHSELGYVQDAQGFVFISGVIIGLYYTRMIAKGQTSLMDAKILNRAYELYVYAVVVLAVILFLAVLVPNSRPLWGHFMWEMYQTPTLTGISAFLLLYQPTFMDILPQYIIYLVASPLLLRWIARGYWREVLGGSVLLWLMVQLGLHLPVIRIVEETVGTFAPASCCAAISIRSAGRSCSSAGCSWERPTPRASWIGTAGSRPGAPTC
ncbi:OpgC domain-containing protein [Skermanella pratensis]|uniref:OpgC domain-containing protein n=1 Tax=Skermanella pratensis TaxID=2233999 RepID=UPI0013011CFA|nr:OpgC domain-containing protein [Skermanella pratensis]